MKGSKDKKEKDKLVKTIIEGIQEVKGQEILELDLTKLDVSICDTFIICHGGSTTQVDAIGDKVQEFTRKKLNQKAWKTSGYENCEWVILDYFDIIVHIFLKETRSVYNLEDLWSDANIITHEEIAIK
ncbi:MAG: ribosome-associated protein [Patiriisocius sp.]|jgi:ribosome-associated protein